MLYCINHARLVSSVIPLDYSPQKKGESEKKYKTRIREMDDKFFAALKKCKEYGWKNWLKTERQTEEGMCRYFTNEICPSMPITQLVVEG